MLKVSSFLTMEDGESERLNDASLVIEEIKQAIQDSGGVVPKGVIKGESFLSVEDWFASLSPREMRAELFCRAWEEVPGLLKDPKETFFWRGSQVKMPAWIHKVFWTNELWEHKLVSHVGQSIQSLIADLPDLQEDAEDMIIGLIESVSQLHYKASQIVFSSPRVREVIKSAEEKNGKNQFFRRLGARQSSSTEALMMVNAFVVGGYEEELKPFMFKNSGILKEYFIAEGFFVGEDFLQKIKQEQKHDLLMQSIADYWEKDRTVANVFPCRVGEIKSLMTGKEFNLSEMGEEGKTFFEWGLIDVAAKMSPQALKETLQHSQLREILARNANRLFEKVMEKEHSGWASERQLEVVDMVLSLGVTQKTVFGEKFFDLSYCSRPGVDEKKIKDAWGSLQDRGLSLNDNFWGCLMGMNGVEGKRFLKRFRRAGIVEFDGDALRKFFSKSGASNVLAKFFMEEAPEAINSFDSEGRPAWWSVNVKYRDELIKEVSREMAIADAKNGEYLFFNMVAKIGEKDFLTEATAVYQTDCYTYGVNPKPNWKWVDSEGNNLFHHLMRLANIYENRSGIDHLMSEMEVLGLTEEVQKKLFNQKNNKGQLPIDMLLESAKKKNTMHITSLSTNVISKSLSLIDFNLMDDKDEFIKKVHGFMDRLISSDRSEEFKAEIEKILIVKAFGLQKNQRAAPCRKI